MQESPLQPRLRRCTPRQLSLLLLLLEVVAVVVVILSDQLQQQGDLSLQQESIRHCVLLHARPHLLSELWQLHQPVCSMLQRYLALQMRFRNENWQLLPLT
jgi:hypothetical protein